MTSDPPRPNMPYEPYPIVKETAKSFTKGFVSKAAFTIALLLTSLIGSAGALDYSSEVCGDGYDNAASGHTEGACPAGWMNALWDNGCDKLCPGEDEDWDGYPASQDCDDRNKAVFPGTISETGCSANQFKTCQSDGTYTACGNLHTGSGSTYVIDPSTGSDANVGSFASPWATYLPLSQTTLGGYHAPIAGDVILVKTNGTITSKWDSDSGAGIAYKAVWFNNTDGTSSNPIKVYAWPGYTPTISPSGCTSTDPCNPVLIDGSDYVYIYGLKITGSFGDGVLIQNSAANIRLEGNEIYDNDCNEDNNCTGVKINSGSNNTRIARNAIHNNFERGVTDGNDENDTQVVTFSTTGNDWSWNTVWNTVDGSDTSSRSGCFKFKHGSSGASDTVRGNIFRHCAETGCIGTASSGQTIERNLCLDSNHFVKPKNWGGNTYLANLTIQDNTAIGVRSSALEPDNADGATAVSSPIVTSTRNVFVDGRTSYDADGAFLRINHYRNDASFTSYGNTTHFPFSNNCYYNSAVNFSSSTSFASLWGGNADLGSKQHFVTWQGNSFDSGSYVENPTLDSDFQGTSTNCDDKGRLFTTTTTTTTTTTLVSTGLPSVFPQ